MSRKTIAKKHAVKLRAFASDELYCPITRELFHKPVLASDGSIYEESAIRKWILTRRTSPVTGELLKTPYLFPLKMIERAIDTMASAHLLPANEVKELHAKREKAKRNKSDLAQLCHAFQCADEECTLSYCKRKKTVVERMRSHNRSCSTVDCKICSLFTALNSGGAAAVLGQHQRPGQLTPSPAVVASRLAAEHADRL